MATSKRPRRKRVGETVPMLPPPPPVAPPCTCPDPTGQPKGAIPYADGNGGWSWITPSQGNAEMEFNGGTSTPYWNPTS